jgi:hypothetical protein
MRPLKMSDGATVELIKSIKCSRNFKDLNPLHDHVWNQCKQLVYREPERAVPALGLVQEISENVQSLVLQN